MTTAAPHVKLLRQLSDARDDYRSGALDVGWDGGHATLFMVFGQPSHAVFEEKGKGRVEGNAALAAWLRDLPPVFSVEPWRRAMTPSETLHCTIDDLVHHFAELAAAHAPATLGDPGPSVRVSAADDSPDLPFDLTTFPLLPDGDTVGPEVPADGARVMDVAERLGSGLLTLIGPRLRAVAPVRDGELIDAVWVDATSHATGETAAMAIVGAAEGNLTALRLPGEVASAVAMLWRLPVEQRAMNLKWLDPDALVESFTRAGDDRVVIVDAAVRGVALLVNGRLVAVYSSEQRRPGTEHSLLRALLAQPDGRVTILRRVSRDTSPASELAGGEPEQAEATSLGAAWYEPLPEMQAVPVAPDAATAPAQLWVDTTAPADDPAAPASVPWTTEEAEPDEGGDLGVDFAAVRRELIQVCEAWVGERDGQDVTALIARTRSSVDDFVTTIDTIRSMEIPGCEPSLVEAMAREMQSRAAERLCAA
jgi:hypothetical protein